MKINIIELMGLLDLPPEILTLIFQNIEIFQILKNIFRICKITKYICSDKYFWEIYKYKSIKRDIELLDKSQRRILSNINILIYMKRTKHVTTKEILCRNSYERKIIHKISELLGFYHTKYVDKSNIITKCMKDEVCCPGSDCRKIEVKEEYLSGVLVSKKEIPKQEDIDEVKTPFKRLFRWSGYKKRDMW